MRKKISVLKARICSKLFFESYGRVFVVKRKVLRFVVAPSCCSLYYGLVGSLVGIKCV